MWDRFQVRVIRRRRPAFRARSVRRNNRGNFSVVCSFDRAVGRTADLAFWIYEQVKRQRRIWTFTGRFQPIFTLVSLFEPVARVQTRGGLAIEKISQLAVVIVERDERQAKGRTRLGELLLEAEQPRDLFFARRAP